MTAPSASDEPDRDLEEILDERFAREEGPVDRGLSYIMLALAAAVGVAGLAGRMELVTANADLLAVFAGIAGTVWITRDARRGETRFGRRGFWTVRREAHPVVFWILVTVYATVFVGLTVFGLAHRFGR